MLTIATHEVYIRPYDAHLAFDTDTHTSTSAYLGRCRRCKQAVRLNVAQHARLHPVWSDGDKLYIAERTFTYAPLAEHARYVRDRTGSYVTLPCLNGCTLPHSAHQEPQQIICKRIDGRHNADIRCGAKCQTATGPSCECACGGANHGGRYAVG